MIKKIVISFVLLLILSSFIAFTPLFKIRTIEVMGHKHYESQQILDILDFSIGDNWFKTLSFNIGDIVFFRNSKTEERIKQYRHYVKSVNVSYSGSGTVKIEIEERIPIGMVPYLGTNLVLDRGGFVVETQFDRELIDVPLIRGINFRSYELGKVLVADNPQNLQVFNKINYFINQEKNSNDSFYEYINYIDVSDIHNVLMLIDSRITVKLGDYRDIDAYRVNFLKQIFLNKIDNVEEGLLDFTSGPNPRFIPNR